MSISEWESTFGFTSKNGVQSSCFFFCLFFFPFLSTDLSPHFDCEMVRLTAPPCILFINRTLKSVTTLFTHGAKEWLGTGRRGENS